MQSNMDWLVLQYGEIVKFFVNIAKTIPGNSQDCRFRLLSDFNLFNFEMFRKLRNNNSEAGKVAAMS